MFQHNRTQHAVGHGFFHTGRFSLSGSNRPFTYVYDCGSKKPSTLLAPAIDVFLKSIGASGIDLLILSHFHSDHTNGLDYLFGKTSVKTVIVPYVSLEERLLLLAEILRKDAYKFDDVTRVTAPEVWLKARGVTSIITINHGTNPTPERTQAEDEPPEAGADWTLRERGSNRTLQDGSTVLDQTPIELHRGIPYWCFDFFCYQNNKQSSCFRDLLNEGFKLPKLPAEFNKEHYRDAIIEIIRNKAQRKDLTACYAKFLPSKINWSSLCLRSAPNEYLYGHRYTLSSYGHRYTLCRQVPQSLLDLYPFRSGVWLGTGDAELQNEAVWGEFSKRYADLDEVSVMSIPHHGSEKNWNEKLLEFRPVVTFATCPDGSSHHPDLKVAEMLAQNSQFVKVTGSTESEINEALTYLDPRSGR